MSRPVQGRRQKTVIITAFDYIPFFSSRIAAPVPRCKLVDLLFLSTLEAMEGADRTFLMSINQVIFIQVTDAKMRGSVISVYKYFPL